MVHKKEKIGSIFTGFLAVVFMLCLNVLSYSKALPAKGFLHKLFFEKGVEIVDNSVMGKINGKTVVLKLSDRYKIFIETYCYSSGCKDGINYRRVSLDSLKKKSLKNRNEEKQDKIYIPDPVAVELNRLGFVKKILIVRIPE